MVMDMPVCMLTGCRIESLVMGMMVLDMLWCAHAHVDMPVCMLTGCRVESLAILLQTRSPVPAIVCKGEHAAPQMLDEHLLSSPGMGELSCCRMCHKRKDAAVKSIGAHWDAIGFQAPPRPNGILGTVESGIVELRERTGESVYNSRAREH